MLAKDSHRILARASGGRQGSRGRQPPGGGAGAEPPRRKNRFWGARPRQIPVRTRHFAGAVLCCAVLCCACGPAASASRRGARITGASAPKSPRGYIPNAASRRNGDRGGGAALRGGREQVWEAHFAPPALKNPEKMIKNTPFPPHPAHPASPGASSEPGASCRPLIKLLCSQRTRTGY